ncbi:MAG: hypothetical protein ACM3VZ_09710 [Acidobacteriota bacterium]
MRTFTTSLLLSLLAVCDAASAQSADQPPLTGSWQYRQRGTSCTEQYFFRSDGTVMVTSGREVSESTYTLSDEPVEGGFYKFDSEVTQTNGKSDCQGKRTPVGQQTSSYLRFQANGERLVLCKSPNLSACMGPLIRLKGRIGT